MINESTSSCGVALDVDVFYAGREGIRWALAVCGVVVLAGVVVLLPEVTIVSLIVSVMTSMSSNCCSNAVIVAEIFSTFIDCSACPIP